MAGDTKLLWYFEIVVPWSVDYSKNRLLKFAHNRVFMTSRSRHSLDAVTHAVRLGLGERRVVQAKLWLYFHIEKPNHRSDAINVLDGLCDAVKRAVGLDDRWFSIAGLDWSVVRTKPLIRIGLGQTVAVDHYLCGQCGGLTPAKTCSPCRARKARHLTVVCDHPGEQSPHVK